MLTPTAELLKAAQVGGYAIGGFNIYNLEGVKAVVGAAEAKNSAVLLQIHPAALKTAGLPLIDLCLSYAKFASVPVAVHLDHTDDVGIIDKAIEAGVSSIMADGSHLSLEKNRAFVGEVVMKARAKHITVEAEIGRISGTEDGLTVADYEARMTDPDDAVRFMAQTGAAFLAVCIGNVHGVYHHPPQLDFDRLQTIREKVDVPLVLHGASGIPEAMIRRSIELGVCKFNVNTEVRTAYLDVLRSVSDDDDLTDIMEHGVQAMQRVVEDKMVLFGSVDSAEMIKAT